MLMPHVHETVEQPVLTPLSESHRKLLDERLREHEENPDEVEPWDKVRDDVLADLQAVGDTPYR